LKLIGSVQGNKNKEHELHKKFQKHKYNSEWFIPSSELISFINEISNEYFVEVIGDEIQLFRKMKK